MRLEGFIARRYLKSKPKRHFLSVITFISISGVALGVMALTIVLGVMNGFNSFLIDKIIGTESHILLTDRYEGQLISNYREIIQKLETMESVRAASPIITNLVMLERDGRTAGAIIKGIDVSREMKVTALKDYLERGSLTLGQDGILVGRELARSLGVGLGDKVKILAPGNKKPRSAKYEIKGIFYSGYYEYDANLVYLALPAVREFFGLPDGVTGIEVKLTDPNLAAEVAGVIREKLEYPAKTWMQFTPNLFAALKLEKIVQFIIMVLIVVVAAFNIVSILDMTVSEKTKDIGTLKAIGVTNKSIMAIFVLKGLFIGITGTFLGSGLGFFAVYFLKSYHISLPANIYALSYIPVKLEGMDFIYIVSAAIILTLLASLYPSWQASRLDPVEALRYE